MCLHHPVTPYGVADWLDPCLIRNRVKSAGDVSADQGVA